MARMGRPPRAQDAFKRDVFEALLAVSATKLEVCDYFEMSKASLQRAVKRTYGRKETFETIARKKKTRTKMSLRRRVLAKALDEDRYDRTMLIFAAKAYGGLTERVVIEDDAEQHAERVAAARDGAVVARKSSEVEADRMERLLSLLTSGRRGGAVRPTTAG